MVDKYGKDVVEAAEQRWAIGLIMLISDVSYVMLRSAYYNKKMPKNTASLEPTGFRWAVLPDGNGEVKAYLAYRVEF